VRSQDPSRRADVTASSERAEAPGAHAAVAIDNQMALAFLVEAAAQVTAAGQMLEEQEKAFGLLDSLFSSAPIGLAIYDLELRCLRANPVFAALSGRSEAEAVGATPWELFGELGHQRVPSLRQVIEQGVPLIDQEVSGSLPGSNQETLHLLVSHMPVRVGGGQAIGVSSVVVDVTDRQRLLVAEREARRRTTFLARAGEILDTSLDYETTLGNVASICVPDVADWCSVYLLDDDDLRQVAVTHVRPGGERDARELSERYPSERGRTRGPQHVVRTGRVELHNDIDDELLTEVAVDAEHLRLLRGIGLSASLCAPLQSRGRTLGALLLVFAESGRSFGQGDVEMATELGRRAGIAVENARLFTQRSRIAHTLQADLLPSELPAIAGYELAAGYRAAGEVNEVGGDFYDIFRRPSGEWCLFVGDVSGKGAEAAAVTALARYTLREAAQHTGPPHQILRALNDAMLEHHNGQQFATVCLMCLDPERKEHGLLCLGGHPPPLLLQADGGVCAKGSFGTLLGMVADPKLTDQHLELCPGDTLLLYTDGVIEAGEGEQRLGEEGLAAMLGDLAGQPARDIVEAVERFTVDYSNGHPRDDIAVVALRRLTT